MRLVEEDNAAYDELLTWGGRTVPVTIPGAGIVQGFGADALATALAGGG